MSLTERFKRIICLIFNIPWPETPALSQLSSESMEMDMLYRTIRDSIDALNEAHRRTMDYFARRDLGTIPPPMDAQPNPDEDWIKRYIEHQSNEYANRPGAPIPTEVSPDYDPNDDPSLPIPAALRD